MRRVAGSADVSMHEKMKLPRPASPLSSRELSRVAPAPLIRLSGFSLLLATLVLPGPVRAAGTWAQIVNPPPFGLNNPLLMSDGTVLCGDGGSGWYKLTPNNKGSYHDGTWTPMAATRYSRLFFSSVVLTNGNVYAAGGEYGTGRAHAELYNFLNNSWSDIAQPSGNPGYSDAVSKLLPNGNVLQGTTGGGCYIYNVNANTITATASAAHSQNEACWVRLTNDCVLTIDINSTTSEHYNPATSSWVVDGPVPVNIYGYGAELGAGFVLPNGKAFYIGGNVFTATYTCGSTPSSQGSWVQGPDMVFGGVSYGAVDAPSAMMVNGKILCALGPTNGFNGPTSYFEYDYVSNSFTQVSGPTGLTYGPAPFVTTFLQLPDGTLLYIGGQGSTTVYIYTPDGTPLAQGQPVINSLANNVDGTYHLIGTGFNGITGGAAYGDDWQMDTSYPIVRMTNTASLNVYYARTFGWSSSSIQTGSKVVTTEFALPPGLPAGTYSLVVTANGNASAPTTLIYSPLAAPTGLNAIIGNGQAKLSWDRVSSASGYDLKRATSVNGYYATIATNIGISTTNFTNTGLTNGKTYYYAVAAVNLGGGTSPDSVPLSVTPFGPPPAPTGLIAGPDSYLGVSLTWNPAVGATNYNVKRSTVNGGPYNALALRSSTDYDDTNVVAGTRYYYIVTAVSPGGESANSLQVSALPTDAGDVTNGLAANWSLDDNGGTTAADSSGNGNTGTLAGSPTLPTWMAPGRIGASSLYFDTNSLQSVTANNSASLNMTAAITISAWARATDWNGNRRILQKGNGDNQYRLLAENSTLKFDLRFSAGNVAVTCALPPTNVWTHWAGTYDGINMIIYSNGVAVATQAASGAILTTTDPLAIGKKNTGTSAGDYFYGQLDEVRVYNRALTPTEIATVMHSGDGPLNAPTGLAGYPGNTRASLVWSPSAAASSYNIKRATLIAGPYTTIGTSLNPGYTDNGLTNGMIYYYEVSALNGTNETANTAPVSVNPALGVSFFVNANYGGAGSTAVLGAGNYSSAAAALIANDAASSCRIPNNWNVTVYQNNTFLGAAWTLYSDTPDFSTYSGLDNSMSSCKIVAASAPATPVGLTVVASNASVSLTWRSTAGAANYNLKRSTINGGPYVPLASTTATNFNDPSLANGTTYYYVVSAVNTNLESANSSAVAGTPLASPTGITAIPADAQVSLSWNPAVGATAYNLKRSTTIGGPYPAIVTVAGTNYTDSTVVNGTTYYYVVSSTNTVGESAINGPVGATPLAPPATPAGLTASAGDTQVSLSWNAAAGADGYNLKRSLTNGGPYAIITGPAGTNYTDTGLVNGTTYFYVVSATNALFESSNSSQVSATPVSGPVTLAIGPQTPGQFTLQFSGVDGHTYIVQTSTNLVDWNAVYTNQQSGGLFSYTNTNATDVVRFYRVQQ
jgi:fibronectin type 3 domain-containing protein